MPCTYISCFNEVYSVAFTFLKNELKIPIPKTHTEPIFPVGFMLLHAHSQPNRLQNNVMQSITLTQADQTIEPNFNSFSKWVNQE